MRIRACMTLSHASNAMRASGPDAFIHHQQLHLQSLPSRLRRHHRIHRRRRQDHHRCRPHLLQHHPSSVSSGNVGMQTGSEAGVPTSRQVQHAISSTATVQKALGLVNGLISGCANSGFHRPDAHRRLRRCPLNRRCRHRGTQQALPHQCHSRRHYVHPRLPHLSFVAGRVVKRGEASACSTMAMLQRAKLLWSSFG